MQHLYQEDLTKITLIQRKVTNIRVIREQTAEEDVLSVTKQDIHMKIAGVRAVFIINQTVLSAPYCHIL
ncbi:hypothetical protein HHI36_009891 [Cryptolaemus montrouzieri]|uniref:Uncharacterized protein n=1 Tax=Cryptolaemus montrouzieri TaxID=559131 RepID=A0ABD2MH68_9CUCU